MPGSGTGVKFETLVLVPRSKNMEIVEAAKG